MMPLNKVRKFGAIFFEVISILIIAFYASPELLTSHQYSHQFFLQSDSGNPIVYYGAPENLQNAHSLPKIQIAGQHDWDIKFDLPSLEFLQTKLYW